MSHRIGPLDTVDNALVQLAPVQHAGAQVAAVPGEPSASNPAAAPTTAAITSTKRDHLFRHLAELEMSVMSLVSKSGDNTAVDEAAAAFMRYKVTLWKAELSLCKPAKLQDVISCLMGYHEYRAGRHPSGV